MRAASGAVPPSCLLAQLGDLSDGHSPQIGWALDGFPICMLPGLELRLISHVGLIAMNDPYARVLARWQTAPRGRAASR